LKFVFLKVRDQVDAAEWRFRPHDSFFISPWSTYKDIVSSTFFPVQDAWLVARRCAFDEMYKPSLGEYRQRKTYSSLAPSYGITYRSYQPKGNEWEMEKNKPQRPLRRTKSLINDCSCNARILSIAELVLVAGRLNGVTSCGALFYPSNFEGSEDRRYHRIFWGPNMIDYVTPTARHAASLLLSAY
uniref:Exostosin domain-containing protein n=1 Tax=Syphacia muris TaxID=451379 RepID=A0A0N5AK23_9BILA